MTYRNKEKADLYNLIKEFEVNRSGVAPKISTLKRIVNQLWDALEGISTQDGIETYPFVESYITESYNSWDECNMFTLLSAFNQQKVIKMVRDKMLLARTDKDIEGLLRKYREGNIK